MQELLSLWSQGVYHPPGVDVVTSPEALRTFCCWDFYGGFLKQAPSIINSISIPSSLWKMVGGRGVQNRKFQASNHNLVFLVIGPQLGAHQESHHQNKRHSYYPEICKGFRSPVSGTGSNTKYQNKKKLLHIIQGITRVSGVCVMSQEGRPMYVFSIILQHHRRKTKQKQLQTIHER